MKISLFIDLTGPQKYNLLSFAGSLILALSSSALIWVNRDNFPIAVPLWFSRDWGESQLATPTFLWILPAAILSLAIINSLIASYVWPKSSVLGLLLTFSNLTVSSLFFFTLFRIIQVTT